MNGFGWVLIGTMIFCFALMLIFASTPNKEYPESEDKCEYQCLDNYCYDRIITCPDGTRWFYDNNTIKPLKHPCDEDTIEDIIIIKGDE